MTEKMNVYIENVNIIELASNKAEALTDIVGDFYEELALVVQAPGLRRIVERCNLFTDMLDSITRDIKVGVSNLYRLSDQTSLQEADRALMEKLRSEKGAQK